MSSAAHHRRPPGGPGRLSGRDRSRGGILAALLAAAALPLLASCAPGAAPGPGGGSGPSVLLITMDTTRADRLGCYGYEAGSTPALDRLARSGILFQQAYTPSVLTVPAHASILTGLLPAAHGVRDNGTDILHGDVETLAEILEGAGYRTGAFVSSAVLEAMYGLDQGFQTYDDSTAKDTRFTVAYAERDAGSVTDAALAWLGQGGGEPWLLWVHYFDPHSPFKPPAPWSARFAGDLYDGEIAFMDSAIGRLLEGAGAGGGEGAPIVVVAGDHGEGLGDHGELSHGVFLYDETARVPLIISIPGDVPGAPGGGSRVPSVVSTADIVPTLLDLARLPVPERVRGASLRPLWEGGDSRQMTRALSEAVMPATMYGWSPLASLRSGKWKYIHGPDPELYDMQADPGETDNVIAARGEVAAGMRGEMEEILEEAARGAPRRERATPGADQLERLRSLGYVAGAGDITFRQALEEDPLTLLKGGARGMIDPRSRASKLVAIETVMRSYGTGRLDEAVPLALGLLKENPDNILVRRYLAAAYRKQGELSLALAEYRKILSRQPGNTDALIGAGWSLMRMERFQEARAAYQRVLDVQPRSVDALASLGSLDLIEGKFEAAERRFRRVLEARPGHVQSILTLARIAESRGRGGEALDLVQGIIDADPGNLNAWMTRSRIQFQAGDAVAALKTLDEAESFHPDRGELSYARGNIYLGLGDLDGAQAAFKKAALQAPQAPHGFHGMGLVALRRGDREAARRYFHQALTIAPGFPDSEAALERLGGSRALDSGGPGGKGSSRRGVPAREGSSR